MNREILLNHLNMLTSAEVFYHTCQNLEKKSQHQLADYLNKQDRSALLERGILLPDTVLPDDFVMHMSHPLLGGSSRSVRVLRFPRYLRAFRHTHDFFTILYVLQGTASHDTSGYAGTLTEGDLCLLSPHIFHSLYVPGDSLVLEIAIAPHMLENIFLLTPSSSNVVSDFFRCSVFLKDYASCLLFHTQGDFELQEQILAMYLEEFNHDEYADKLITHLLIIFLIRLIRKYRKTAESPLVPLRRRQNEDAAIILRYLQQNYATASLAELADLLNYSVPHCSKHVTACTGQGFAALQKQIRLRKATDYLKNTMLTVGQISERVGYENPENFIRMFKKEYGISPSQYRLGQHSPH